MHTLRFIKQARNLGFSIELIKDLLDLWQNHNRSSQQVKKLAHTHLDMVEERIAELTEIKKTLEDLMQQCHGDNRPECPIIDHLATASIKESSTKT